MKKFFLFVALFVLNICLAQIKDENYELSTLPKVTQIVNDFEGVLDEKEETELYEILYQYNLKTTNQIVIVTVKSIEPFKNIFDFSLNLAQRTGPGIAGKDNGIMIVFSKNLREIQIQNGDGILDKLTNEEAKKIIDEIIIPEFKKGNYCEGLKKGILEIQRELS